MEHMFHIQLKDEIFGEDWLKSFATEILDAKYKKTDVAEVMKGLSTWKDFQRRQQSTLDQHLTSTEQSQKTKAISVADDHGHFAHMF